MLFEIPVVIQKESSRKCRQSNENLRGNFSIRNTCTVTQSAGNDVPENISEAEINREFSILQVVTEFMSHFQSGIIYVNLLSLSPEGGANFRFENYRKSFLNFNILNFSDICWILEDTGIYESNLYLPTICFHDQNCLIIFYMTI